MASSHIQRRKHSDVAFASPATDCSVRTSVRTAVDPHEALQASLAFGYRVTNPINRQHDCGDHDGPVCDHHEVEEHQQLISAPPFAHVARLQRVGSAGALPGLEARPCQQLAGSKVERARVSYKQLPVVRIASAPQRETGAWLVGQQLRVMKEQCDAGRSLKAQRGRRVEAEGARVRGTELPVVCTASAPRRETGAWLEGQEQCDAGRALEAQRGRSRQVEAEGARRRGTALPVLHTASAQASHTRAWMAGQQFER